MCYLDTLFPVLSDQFFKVGGLLVAYTVIIAIVFPFFTLALILIIAIYYFPYKLSEGGINETKRLDNMTKSPLLSHLATSIQGSSTIKAYKMEKKFQLKFSKLQDRNSVALFLFGMSLQWASEKFDLISLLIVLVTFIFPAALPKEMITPSMTALSLTYAITVCDMVQSVVRQAVQSEAMFKSAKRILNYINDLESEAPGSIEHRRPPTGWPEEGRIVFHEVNVRYREGLPLVLKNISFEVKPQEKIGIVG
ncbi:ABCC5 [Bugula neritina]|uniref:ABCC5 n=1 Tax=Bugula neritina TaxID=10212 RepID=A0A7J7JEM2_BUGNE|nr:ABCC5 [Bugula neritina]